MNTTLGQRLRVERKRLGMTQTELGEVAGVRKQAIIHYETDKRHIGALTLAKLRSCGVDVVYVLTGERARQRVGERLKEEREALGLDLSDVGAYLHASSATVAAYESGALPLPVDTFRQLDALCIDTAYVATGTRVRASIDWLKPHYRLRNGTWLRATRKPRAIRSEPTA